MEVIFGASYKIALFAEIDNPSPARKVHKTKRRVSKETTSTVGSKSKIYSSRHRCWYL